MYGRLNMHVIRVIIGFRFKPDETPIITKEMLINYPESFDAFSYLRELHINQPEHATMTFEVIDGSHVDKDMPTTVRWHGKLYQAYIFFKLTEEMMMTFRLMHGEECLMFLERWEE